MGQFPLSPLSHYELVDPRQYLASSCRAAFRAAKAIGLLAVSTPQQQWAAEGGSTHLVGSVSQQLGSSAAFWAARVTGGSSAPAPNGRLSHDDGPLLGLP